MSWNHRIIRTEDEGGICYAVHECHYNQKTDTVPQSWSTEAASVSSESRFGMFWILARMAASITQPVLEIRDRKLVEVEPAYTIPDEVKAAINTLGKYAPHD